MADGVAGSLSMPLRAYTVGAGGDLGDAEGTWADVYRIRPAGVVLVRPDGHMAWRACTGGEDAPDALERALRNVLGRRLAH